MQRKPILYHSYTLGQMQRISGYCKEGYCKSALIVTNRAFLKLRLIIALMAISSEINQFVLIQNELMHSQK